MAEDTWTLSSRGLPNSAYIWAVLIDPGTPSTLYTLPMPITGGYLPVYKSVDAGATWTAMNGGRGFAWVLALDPASPATLYAANPYGNVFVSTDGAANWSAVSAPTLASIGLIAFGENPGGPSTVYAGSGSSGSGVFNSSDQGTNWSEIITGLSAANVSALAVDPAALATIYAGTSDTSGGGMFKSTDGGASWTPASKGLPNGPVLFGATSVIVDPVTTTTLYAAGNGVGGGICGVYKSIDGAGSWAAANSGLSGQFVFALAIDPATSSTVYAGTYSGVFKSTDGAATWNAVNTGLAVNGVTPQVSALAINPATPSTIYAKAVTSNLSVVLFKSVNGGASWSVIATGTTEYPPQGVDLAVDPHAPDTIYYMTSNGLNKSTDGGATWNTTTVPGAGYYYALALSPLAPTAIYVGTDQAGFYQSFDGGTTWSQFNPPLAVPQVNALAFDPGGSTVFAGTSAGVLTHARDPVLAVTVTHTGSFWVGQNGDTYSVTVSNEAGAATSGAVTVTDTIPSGLSLVSMAGAGWSCPTGGTACTRSDSLAAGASYPPITVTVNVAANATTPQVNAVSVSGGGSGGASASDSTNVYSSGPWLFVIETYSGSFAQGQIGTYAVYVGNLNSSSAPTTGAVTVTESMPSGLTLLSMAGDGWTCPAGGATCTRSDSLLGGRLYSPITVAVRVTAAAGSIQPNTVTVSGGGSATISRNDSVTISSIPVQGSITEYPVPTAASEPWGIAAGPDGAIWFTEFAGNKIGRITTAGVVTEYPVPTASSQPNSITAGPDGALWFLEQEGNKVGRITTAGSVTEYSIPTTSSLPEIITVGPDGALWFTEVYKIGRLTVSGVFTEYTVPTTNSDLGAIAAGPDGALWFTENSGNKIGRITTTGSVSEYSVPTSGSEPEGITVGPDGALWFVEWLGSKIGRITTTGSITEYSVPGLARWGGGLGITTGPDGALWFSGSYYIGRIDTTGALTTYSIPNPWSGAVVLVVGADQAIWFAEGGGNVIGRIVAGSPIAPKLSVAKSHSGSFSQGQQNVVYSVTVSSATGTGPTNGTVTVTEAPPPGMNLVSMAGTGWACAAGGNACSRSDAAVGGQSYPPITATLNVTNTASTPQVNGVSVSGGGSASASATDSAPIALSLATTYLEGDVYPYNADSAPSFGDGVLDIRDLIQELFAVNNIPGFKPASCSDRFDAMDLYPTDSGTTRGGDGILDIRDLIVELFRVNDLDMIRPVRVSRGGACGSSGTVGTTELDAAGRGVVARGAGPVAGLLLLERAEGQRDGSERAPVYLEAIQDLNRTAITFGLGDQQSDLRFTAAAGLTPPLVEDSQRGVVAAAWLNGVTVLAGERVLLGYVTGPAASLANVRFYGASASGLDDNHQVRLGTVAPRP